MYFIDKQCMCIKISNEVRKSEEITSKWPFFSVGIDAYT